MRTVCVYVFLVILNNVQPWLRTQNGFLVQAHCQVESLLACAVDSYRIETTRVITAALVTSRQPTLIVSYVRTTQGPRAAVTGLEDHQRVGAARHIQRPRLVQLFVDPV